MILESVAEAFKIRKYPGGNVGSVRMEAATIASRPTGAYMRADLLSLSGMIDTHLVRGQQGFDLADEIGYSTQNSLELVEGFAK